MIDKPVRYGSGFAKPSRKKMRESRNQSTARMLEAKEIKLLLDDAGPDLKAMILVGLNCGFGQSDLSSLPQSAIDWRAKMIDYPRPKTAIPRRCPLWPETMQAMRDAIEVRPEPKHPADADLCFLTRRGERWVKISQGEKKAWSDSLGLKFGKLLRKHDLKRPGLNFYALRHTFETIAGESLDQVAVNHIMGHVDNSMSARYRERIGDDRLIAVSNHVRKWLFPKAK
ncbi:tyrosine-type recombinase/integrase [Polystyrenella longa]|nr:tyrosine-type recombinase/integrase [Polystyrenella longa]